jgi:hypothetical protein
MARESKEEGREERGARVVESGSDVAAREGVKEGDLLPTDNREWKGNSNKHRHRKTMRQTDRYDGEIGRVSSTSERRRDEKVDEGGRGKLTIYKHETQTTMKTDRHDGEREREREKVTVRAWSQGMTPRRGRVTYKLQENDSNTAISITDTVTMVRESDGEMG